MQDAARATPLLNSKLLPIKYEQGVIECEIMWDNREDRPGGLVLGLTTKHEQQLSPL